MPKIICVVPTIRRESIAKFREAWKPLFEKHRVTLITVWDGEDPTVTTLLPGEKRPHDAETQSECNIDFVLREINSPNRDLFCRFSDVCRNIGFVEAARHQPDYVLTLDDDCYPVEYNLNKYGGSEREVIQDPIQAHIDALNKKVSITWMNTAHDTDLYLRGVPYRVREESPVMLSHGVWVGTPDFDGETQLKLEGHGSAGMTDGVPYSLPYYVGPVPRGVLFPLCGMNVMVRQEALPHLYFAPMGKDTGIMEKCPRCQGTGNEPLTAKGSDPCQNCDKCIGYGEISALNRFGDIWMGIALKREFDRLGWAIYTGNSTILHSRASDARKNYEQEKLGRRWNEWMTNQAYAVTAEEEEEFMRFQTYMHDYYLKKDRYAQLITSIFNGKGVKV